MRVVSNKWFGEVDLQLNGDTRLCKTVSLNLLDLEQMRNNLTFGLIRLSVNFCSLFKLRNHERYT